MKSSKLMLAIVVLFMTGVGTAVAGHRTHGHVGIYFGAPWGPWYGPPSYYYAPPPVVVVPAPPPVYIEQGSAPARASGYWYYCDASQTYYPYVKDCPGGWQTVTPQPPPR